MLPGKTCSNRMRFRLTFFSPSFSPARRLLPCGPLIALMAVAIAASFGLVASASAETMTWYGPDGFWDVGANWQTTLHVPVAGDDAWVKAPTSTHLTVTYRNAANPTLATVYLDGANYGDLSFLQSQDELRAGTEYVGHTGSASYALSAGTNTVAGDLDMGFFSGASGSYDLSGTGSLTAGREFIGVAGVGHFTQSAGSNTVSGDFSLTTLASSSATYDLTGAGGLSASREYIGNDGHGDFTQSGGTNTIANLLTLGNLWNGVGSYALSGTGSLQAQSERIGGLGHGTVTQTGGSNTVAGALDIAWGWGSHGTYDLQGGTLDANSITNGAGGTFAFSGGSVVTSGVSNSGTMNLSGAGTRTIASGVNNSGTVNVSNTHVDFGGTFNHTGAYLIDAAGPSESDFTVLNVGQAGYLSAAGTGDVVSVSEDLLMSSNRTTLWKTELVDLVLGVSVDHQHTLEYSGADLGADYGGYTDNFAWQSLLLMLGESLTLQDGDTTPGAALYVRDLILQGGLAQIASIQGNGSFNIYYDPAQTANGYLGGLSYALSGGGSILPVPEPSTLLLLGAGFAGMAWARRRAEMR